MGGEPIPWGKAVENRPTTTRNLRDNLRFAARGRGSSIFIGGGVVAGRGGPLVGEGGRGGAIVGPGRGGAGG